MQNALIVDLYYCLKRTNQHSRKFSANQKHHWLSYYVARPTSQELQALSSQILRPNDERDLTLYSTA